MEDNIAKFGPHCQKGKSLMINHLATLYGSTNKDAVSTTVFLGEHWTDIICTMTNTKCSIICYKQNDSRSAKWNGLNFFLRWHISTAVQQDLSALSSYANCLKCNMIVVFGRFSNLRRYVGCQNPSKVVLCAILNRKYHPFLISWWWLKYKESKWNTQKTKTYSLETDIWDNPRRFKIRAKILLMKNR